MFESFILIKKNYKSEEYINLLSQEDELFDIVLYNDYYCLPYDDFDSISTKALSLSKELNTTIIAVLIADSDVAIFELFDCDKHILICLGDIEGIYDEVINNENVDLISEYLADDYTIDNVYEIINDDFIFVEENIYSLLKMMGINVHEMIG